MSFIVEIKEDLIKIKYEEIHVEFTKSKIDKRDLVQMKGLLHSKPLNDIDTQICIDDSESLFLIYEDGRICLSFTYKNTSLNLPIVREMYGHLDRLLDSYI